MGDIASIGKEPNVTFSAGIYTLVGVEDAFMKFNSLVRLTN